MEFNVIKSYSPLARASSLVAVKNTPINILFGKCFKDKMEE